MLPFMHSNKSSSSLVILFFFFLSVLRCKGAAWRLMQLLCKVLVKMCRTTSFFPIRLRVALACLICGETHPNHQEDQSCTLGKKTNHVRSEQDRN